MRLIKAVCAVLAGAILLTSVCVLSGCENRSNKHDASYYEYIENHEGDY